MCIKILSTPKVTPPGDRYTPYAGLKYDECVRKMQLLTLASLGEECRDIPFATLTAELNLPAEDLEMFVVEGECVVFGYCSIYNAFRDFY